MAKICVPSAIYACQLHCWDSEDESLGDWYEQDHRCATIVRSNDEIERAVRDVIKNGNIDKANRSIAILKQQIERYNELIKVLSNRKSQTPEVNCRCNGTSNNFKLVDWPAIYKENL